MSDSRGQIPKSYSVPSVRPVRSLRAPQDMPLKRSPCQAPNHGRRRKLKENLGKYPRVLSVCPQILGQKQANKTRWAEKKGGLPGPSRARGAGRCPGSLRTWQALAAQRLASHLVLQGQEEAIAAPAFDTPAGSMIQEYRRLEIRGLWVPTRPCSLHVQRTDKALTVCFGLDPKQEALMSLHIS